MTSRAAKMTRRGAGERSKAVALTICLLYMLGWLGTNVVGRRIIEAVEAVRGQNLPPALRREIVHCGPQSNAPSGR